MKPVTFVSFTFARGGAGKAALRIRGLTSLTGRPAFGLSLDSIERDPLSVAVPNILERWEHKLAWITTHAVTKLLGRGAWTKLSMNVIGSRFITRHLRTNTLLHVHWVNNETFSLADFAILNGKSVLTLHDEWFYCGAEHYCLRDGSPDDAYIEGYLTSGITRVLNRWIWLRKRRQYHQIHDVILTVPSKWMKERLQRSPLASRFPVEVVPNPVDHRVFAPVNAQDARMKLGVALGDFVILFGAVGGGSLIKGSDLIDAALQRVAAGMREGTRPLRVLMFGGSEPGTFHRGGIQVTELGTILSEVDLAIIYSCADVTVVPSRVESFGQVAAESQCCGTPVVCFACSGLLDVVVHGQTGYLAEPYVVQSLADGLVHFYRMSTDVYMEYARRAREMMIARFSPEAVAWQYERLYKVIEARMGGV